MNTTFSRFWSKVNIAGPKDCWLWTAATSTAGYGVFRFNGLNKIASRFAYHLANGDIPEDLEVLHRCDTPACCNPAHLFLGTHIQNMQDKLNKGRPNGGGPARVTLRTRELVKAMYALGYKWKKITELTGASPVTISRILKGRYDHASS